MQHQFWLQRMSDNEVDCACGFDKDLREEFATIDCLRRIVIAITLDQEVGYTTTTLNITHVRFNNVEEQGTLRFIVLLEQLRLSSTTDYTFDSEEQTTNVDSIECGRKTESVLSPNKTTPDQGMQRLG